MGDQEGYIPSENIRLRSCMNDKIPTSSFDPISLGTALKALGQLRHSPLLTLSLVDVLQRHEQWSTSLVPRKPVRLLSSKE